MKIYFYILIALSLLACSSKQPEPLDPLANMLQHQVRYQGETLGLISGWYTGKSLNWVQIKSANPGLDVNRIKIGDVILIPRGLLKKTEPFTKDYVSKSVPKAVLPTTEISSESEGKEQDIVDLLEEAQNSGLVIDDLEAEEGDSEIIDATDGIFEKSAKDDGVLSGEVESNPNVTQELKEQYSELENNQNTAEDNFDSFE